MINGHAIEIVPETLFAVITIMKGSKVLWTATKVDHYHDDVIANHTPPFLINQDSYGAIYNNLKKYS